MAQKWSGKSKGGVLGYKIFIYCLKLLGLSPAYLLLRFVAFHYFLFSDSSKNLQNFFHKRIGWSKLKSFFYTYSNYYVFGQTIIDKFAMMANIKTPFTFSFDGEEHLREMIALNQGGVLISGHIGNWEIAGQLLKRINAPRINIVMLEAEHEKIKSLLDKNMGEKNFHVIAVKKDMSHIFEMANAILNKEIICIHADRFVEGQKTKERMFLNEKALFPSGPFEITAKLKVPYSIVFAVKETSYHYKLSATPLKTSRDTDEITTDFVNEFEKVVINYPLQWFNYFEFWKNENDASN